MTPIVSFIIPVRNSAEMLERCLRSIAANDYPRECLEIVVADNGSTDRSREVADAAGAIVLTLPGLRVGELRNRAAHAARGEVLAFIDADHEIRPEWARVAVDALAEPGVRAAGALCHSPVPGTWVQRQYDALRGHPRGRRDVEWLGSGNLGVRRDAFETLGGFDTGLDTCEDVDLCARLRAAGYRLVSDDRLYNTHFGDASTLRELFVGELWRGRDNARVTLRSPLSFRSIVSLLIPVVDLLLIAAGALGLIAWSGPFAIAIVLASIAGVIALAALRAWRKAGTRGLTLLTACQRLAVAAVYDVGRALALVARAGHTVRHSRPAES
ncbi:MAG: hypothetical protein DMF93_16810 [Acidobacteria bacterium]|nr:MAG: hypothetical protein DMF93_16810 [Acidobacteriota bacterium]